MSDDLKREASDSGDSGLGGSCYLIDMCEAYPFGQLRQLQEAGTEVLVRKKLFLCSQQQQAVLQRTAEVLRSVRHPFLINLRAFQQQHNSAYFYYQYVHLTIERWILDLGQEIIDRLKRQMLALAAYLNQHGLCFTFSPQQLGLSHQIDVQYFLHQFSLPEKENQPLLQANLASNQQRIEHFFEGFGEEGRRSKVAGVFSSQLVDSESRKESMQSSITTRESWSPEPKRQVLRAAKSRLSEQVERSRCRTKEILERLRTIRNLHFE